MKTKTKTKKAKARETIADERYGRAGAAAALANTTLRSDSTASLDNLIEKLERALVKAQDLAEELDWDRCLAGA